MEGLGDDGSGSEGEYCGSDVGNNMMSHVQYLKCGLLWVSWPPVPRIPQLPTSVSYLVMLYYVEG